MQLTDGITGGATGVLYDGSGNAIEYTFTLEEADHIPYTWPEHSRSLEDTVGVTTAEVSIEGSYTFNDGNGGGAEGIVLQFGAINEAGNDYQLSVNGEVVNLSDLLASGEVEIVDSSRWVDGVTGYTTTEQNVVIDDGNLSVDTGLSEFDFDFDGVEPVHGAIALKFNFEVTDISWDYVGTDPHRDSIITDIWIDNQCSEGDGITLTGTVKSDELIGTGGNDDISGGNGHDFIFGCDGDDTIDGGNGKDVLNGGSGNDVINGGNGTDVITGGYGDDILTGGNGPDEFIFADGAGSDVITDFKAETDTITFMGGIERSDLTLSQVGTDVVVDYGGPGDQIVLQDIYLQDLTTDDFMFI